MSSSDDATQSSTPLRDHAIFSDEPAMPSSPPSSPPGFPWEQPSGNSRTMTSPPRPTKNAFSVLGKRGPLTDTSDNVRPKKRPAAETIKPETASLTQMQISLGQQVQKRCMTCGMEYVASSEEDRRLHAMYHKQNTEGYDVGKEFVQKTPAGKLFPGATSKDSICAVDCFDTHHRKRKARAALEIVQRELGAVPIAEDDLWNKKGRDARPEYCAYLYIRHTKCVGYLLVQRITDAQVVLAPRDAVAKQPVKRRGSALAELRARKEAAAKALDVAASQPLQLSQSGRPATIGISRIWTSSIHRQQNIATSLLDCAVAQATPPELVKATESQPGRGPETRCTASSKDAVAFSQPTEAGIRLARKWFGKLYGWKVYLD